MRGILPSMIRVALFSAAASAAAVAAPQGTGPPAVPVVSPVSFKEIAHRESPGVVSIVTRRRGRPLDDEENAILRFFELQPPDSERRVRFSAASGFVISQSGEILTNNHVIEGADRIEVYLLGNERTSYRAIRVGTDPLTDSALIRIDAPPPNLHVARLGDSSELEPGDWVMAIGNPFHFGHTVTVGVVSFAQRAFQVQEGRWQDLIQTDAAIFPGNSGGPLFNARGEIVGMNVAMLDAGRGEPAGIGFAVPINAIKALLPRLRDGKVVRGQLGVGLHGGPILTDEAAALHLPTPSGAIVRNVERDSAAERAGLRAGDVIVALDGTRVVDTRALIARTAATPPGTRVTVTASRNGDERTIVTTIEEQPGDEDAELAVADAAEGDDGLVLETVAPTAPAASNGSDVGHVLVAGVTPNSPAAEAELTAGDIIREINGCRIRTAADARQALRKIGHGLPVFLLVRRGDHELFLEMRNP
jgi:serine protease Do